MKDYTQLNRKLFELLSCYLNFSSDAIKPEMVSRMVNEFGQTEEEAVKMLFASCIGLDIVGNEEDKEILFFRCSP